MSEGKNSVRSDRDFSVRSDRNFRQFFFPVELQKLTEKMSVEKVTKNRVTLRVPPLKLWFFRDTTSRGLFWASVAHSVNFSVGLLVFSCGAWGLDPGNLVVAWNLAVAWEAAGWGLVPGRYFPQHLPCPRPQDPTPQTPQSQSLKPKAPELNMGPQAPRPKSQAPSPKGTQQELICAVVVWVLSTLDFAIRIWNVESVG